MFVVISIMLGAIVPGYIIRHMKILQHINKLITATIAILLLTLGIGVGSNQTIIDNLSTLGMQAVLLATMGVLGSSITAVATYHWFFKPKKKRN